MIPEGFVNWKANIFLYIYMDISGNNVGNPGCLDWGYASGFASGVCFGVCFGDCFGVCFGACFELCCGEGLTTADELNCQA